MGAAIPSLPPSQDQQDPSAADPPGSTRDSSDALHIIVVIIGLGLMFGAVLFTVCFYGSGGETNAGAILGIFLPAVTGVVGFVFGIKTGTDAGSKAGKDIVSSSKKDVAEAASNSLDILNSLEPAVDTVLNAAPAPAAGSKVRSLDAKPGAPAPIVELQEFRDQYNRKVAELKGRLKQAAGIR